MPHTDISRRLAVHFNSIQLTYSTTRPGVWMVFYDVVPPVSDSATVGAQSSVDVCK
jgi:hypothetical protein